MNVSIVEQNIANMILPLTMYAPDVLAVVTCLGTAYQPASSVIKTKEAMTG